MYTYILLLRTYKYKHFFVCNQYGLHDYFKYLHTFTNIFPTPSRTLKIILNIFRCQNNNYYNNNKHVISTNLQD